PRLVTFASSVKDDGFTDVVLLGMGGSSLAPEVFRGVLGVAPGWPRLHMLDSTDPAAIRAATTTPDRTLYLIASKSGTTIEPNSLAAHFRRVLEDAGILRWADHFVAITDEGTELARRARAEGFRDLFINPGDIGGRYSALSFFGLVPAALMGQNIGALVGWAIAMLSASEPGLAGAPTDRGRKRCATPTFATSRRRTCRSPRSSCRSRPRSAPNSYAGRSPPLSPARCSTSTRSTSRTCSKPKTRRGRCWIATSRRVSC